MSAPRELEVRRLIGRFSIAGVFNSLVGYAVIYLTMWLGLNPVWANVVGYGVGLALAYQLSLRFVFSPTGHSRSRVFRFLLTFGIAYMLNLLVLRQLLASGVHSYLAQIIAAIPYLLGMFLLSRFWVFRDRVS